MARPAIRLSNSSTRALLRCEQKYVYKYVDGLAARIVALPLKLGTWVHALLEAKYEDGFHSGTKRWQAKNQELAKGFKKLMPAEREYYGDLPTQADIIMKGYEHTWKGEEEDWSIVDTELKVEHELGKGWVFVGKIDVVAEDHDGLWIWDHKTHKGAKPTDDYRIIDPQSALYVRFYELITGRKPTGFIFNYLRTKLPSVPRLLKNGTLSKAKIDTNYITMLNAIRGYGLDPKEYRPQLSMARARDRDFYDRIFINRPTALIRNLLLDIKEKAPRIRELHEGARPARTLTKDCKWDCEFHLLCLTELTGGDGTYIRKHDFEERRWEEIGDEETVIQSV